MNKPLILVVEDDNSVRNLITTTLKAHDYRYLTAPNGSTAILEASSHNPDIVLLDLGLPDIDGVDVIKKIRTWSNMPIIVISARSEDTDKIDALDAGADDYLTKPFHNGELLARIRSAIRSIREEKDQSAILSFGDLTIDMLNHCVKKKNEIIKLTSTEFSILSLMAQNAGKVLTHQYLLKEVWGVAYQSQPQYLRVFIAQLRKKIENDPSFPAFILTESGIGYRFSEQTEK